MVTDIAEVFYADLAGEEAVGGKLAQRGKEFDTWSESGVSLGVLTIRDEIEDCYLLHATTFKIALAIAVNAGRVEPLDPAAELQLVNLCFRWSADQRIRARRPQARRRFHRLAE